MRIPFTKRFLVIFPCQCLLCFLDTTIVVFLPTIAYVQCFKLYTWFSLLIYNDFVCLHQVNAHVKALRTLCRRKALNQEEADFLVMRWVNQLQSKASQVLELCTSEIVGANKAQTLLTPQVNTSQTEPRRAKLIAKAIIAIYTIGSLVIVCPSTDLKTIVPAIHTIITSGSSDPKSRKLPGNIVSMKQSAPSLYLQGWLTMGKICLADGKLAKRYLPLFVQVHFKHIVGVHNKLHLTNLYPYSALEVDFL